MIPVLVLAVDLGAQALRQDHAVSAHWYVAAVTAMPRPRTLHDFGGFPQALFDVRYPEPGLPALAQQ